jgi:hypothetical protein
MINKVRDSSGCKTDGAIDILLPVPYNSLTQKCKNERDLKGCREPEIINKLESRFADNPARFYFVE